MGWNSNDLAARAGRFAKRFLSARRGNVAMIFGLAFIPLIIACGAAVDLSRALVVRARLAQALDAAGLAAGATTGLTDDETKALAQRYFDANYPANEIGIPGDLDVDVNDSVISLDATAVLPTTLMAIVGIDHLDIAVESEITKETNGLEVALVLDSTLSMQSSGKIEALQAAANELVDILAGDDDNPEQLKIGIVPFAISVRLDTAAAVAANWIDTSGNSSVAQLNFSGGKYAYWLYTNSGGLSNTDWMGCVEARPGGLEETDTPPNAGTPNTQWVPFFHPDEPDISDPSSGSPSGELPRTGDVVNVNQSSLNSNFNSNYIVIWNNSVFGKTITSVNTSNERLTISSHGLSTGNGPFSVTSTSGMPGGLSAGTSYWVNRVDNNTIRLATSAANASAGTVVNITSTGSGTIILTGAAPGNDSFWIAQHSTTVGKDPSYGSASSGHGYVTGEGPVNIYVASSSGAVPTGLSASTSYWIIRTSDNVIKLASSRANALAGTAVDFSVAGTGTRAISEAPAGTSLTAQGNRQKNWEKYVGKSYDDTTAGDPPDGPNTNCGMLPIRPLTNDMNAVRGDINILDDNLPIYTNIPMGLVWGWRLISPTAPYTEGVAYDNDDTVKAIVLMTDGDNCMGDSGCPGGGSVNSLNKTYYTPFGYGSQERLGSGIDTAGAIKAEMDNMLGRICDNIKDVDDDNGDDRILVYTIALMVTDDDTVDLLRDCATDPDMFFNTPSADQLEGVFTTIAEDLSNLRVSK